MLSALELQTQLLPTEILFSIAKGAISVTRSNELRDLELTALLLRRITEARCLFQVYSTISLLNFKSVWIAGEGKTLLVAAIMEVTTGTKVCQMFHNIKCN